MTARSETNYSTGSVYHWGEYRIDRILPPASEGPRILLIGCGDGEEKAALRQLGFEPVGFDINASPGTDVVADAHAIPFADGAFDVALSMQVLEHLHSPWVAMPEIARVLRPGGFFVGSVAFLKAYHTSYFHMSHAAVDRLFRLADLEMDRCYGAQSLTYSLFGGLVPLGPKGFRRKVLGWFDDLLFGTRALIYSAVRRRSSKERGNRFKTPIPMSFSEFDRVKFAPAVVFRGRKAG